MKRYNTSPYKCVFPTAALASRWTYKFHFEKEIYVGPTFLSAEDAWEGYKKKFLEVVREFFHAEDKRARELSASLGGGSEQ